LATQCVAHIFKVNKQKKFSSTYSFTIFHLKRTHGGCVSFIKPEYLLDFTDFKSYLAENQNFDSKLFDGFKEAGQKPAESADVTIESFESVSKKAWLDCLLQILKVFIELSIFLK
jgi:hypothetical protein